MKTFPYNFSIEANKKTGASPVWILKCQFPKTGIIYLSDQQFSFFEKTGYITYEQRNTAPWIASWGAIDEDISGDMALTKVSDFSADIINVQGVSPNIEEILWDADNKIEAVRCELFLWFLGLDSKADPAHLMWSGNIVDFEKLNDSRYLVLFVDQSAKVDKAIGEVLTKQKYPGIDKAEIGKTANIIYGQCRNVPCHAILAGAQTTLLTEMTATSPGNGGSIVVSDASDFPSSGSFPVLIDDERIMINNRSGNTFYLAPTGARGADGTTAAAHKAMSTVAQVPVEYIFLVANHPVKAINDVYINDTLQVSGIDKYTGQPGYEKYGYEGKAVVVKQDRPPLMLSIKKMKDFHSHILEVERDAVHFDDHNNGNTVFGQVFDRRSDTGFSTSTNTVRYYRYGFYAKTGTIRRIRAVVVYGHSSTSGGLSGTLVVNGASIGTFSFGTRTSKGTVASAWWNITASWAHISLPNTYLELSFSDAFVFEAWLEVEYDSNSPAEDVSITGQRKLFNVTVDVDGYMDDTAGSFTGTANALIERPGHVVEHFLQKYANWSEFYSNGDDYFQVKDYKFSLVINETKRLKEWLAEMAFQCRSWFRFANNKAQLIFRPEKPAAVRTISDSMIRMGQDFNSTLSVQRTQFQDICNSITAYYDIKRNASGYNGIYELSHSTSVDQYGEKTIGNLFNLDFVSSKAMAEELVHFYLQQYKDRRRLFFFDVFLDNADLEFADGIAINNILCEVQKVNIAPGSGMESRNDRVAILAKEAFIPYGWGAEYGSKWGTKWGVQWGSMYGTGWG